MLGLTIKIIVFLRMLNEIIITGCEGIVLGLMTVMWELVGC